MNVTQTYLWRAPVIVVVHHIYQDEPLKGRLGQGQRAQGVTAHLRMQCVLRLIPCGENHMGTRSVLLIPFFFPGNPHSVFQSTKLSGVPPGMCSVLKSCGVFDRLRPLVLHKAEMFLCASKYVGNNLVSTYPNLIHPAPMALNMASPRHTPFCNQG